MKKDITAEQILNMLTKEELIQYFKHRYLISRDEAVFITTQALRTRQIRNINKHQQERETRKTSKLTTKEYFKLMQDFDKEDREYDRTDKRIKELEELIK